MSDERGTRKMDAAASGRDPDPDSWGTSGGLPARTLQTTKISCAREQERARTRYSPGEG